MPGTPTMYPTVLYQDAQAAIAQLTKAFGFTVGAKYETEDGLVLHAELSYGNGTVMLGSKGRGGVFAEAMEEAGPVGVYVRVEDTDAHYRRAERSDVEILLPPTDMEYGSREYLARDAEGNVWSFGTYTPAVAAAGAGP